MAARKKKTAARRKKAPARVAGFMGAWPTSQARNASGSATVADRPMVFTPGASVSRKTSEKVRRAAETLGYRPNVLARSLVCSSMTNARETKTLADHYLRPPVTEFGLLEFDEIDRIVERAYTWGCTHLAEHPLQVEQ